MKTIKIEEIKKDVTILTDENDVFESLKENINFIISTHYDCTTNPRNFIESLCKDKEINLIYTDENKHFVKGKYISSPNIMSPYFFEKHKEKIVNIVKNKLLSDPPFSYKLEKPLCDSSFINVAIDSPCKYLTFKDMDLTSAELELLRKERKEIYIEQDGVKNQISFINVFSGIQYDELDNTSDITFKIPIDERHLENIKYLSKNHKIFIDNMTFSFTELSSESYYAELRKIILRLTELGFSNEVNINVKDKVSFNSEYLSYNINYPNLLLKVSGYTYEKISIDEYIKVEDKINLLIPDLSNLSPFEKYLKIYNVVKQLKEYKESENTDESRYLNHIIDNDYIVCLGFSSLLVDLLRKSGINACKYYNTVSVTGDEVQDENSDYYMAGHSRTLVNIVDEKYKIDGFYVVDTTWDNDLNNDKYNYAIGTIDMMQKHEMLMKLESIDYFFDVSNFDDFVLKVNQLLKHTFNENTFSYKSDKEKLFRIMLIELGRILKVIQKLDPVKHLELKLEFDSLQKESNSSLFKNNLEVNQLLKKIDNLYTEVGHYCVSKNNNKVSNEILAKGVLNIGNITHNQIDTFINDFEKGQEIRYPDLFKEDPRSK